MILTIKTNTPICELALYDGNNRQAEKIWESGRQLAVQLPGAIEELLKGVDMPWSDVQGIVIFQGPGSFTGLRIGSTVANTIAYAQKIPVVGTQTEDWIKQGIARLAAKENDKIVTPHYGSEAHITKPKK